ncbi:hypothetical protein L227DRAFT_609436 [Lentinus tigrinus ALCF2SS1-6]|uniref:Uncharacterized protein n=1 Tax=Lentinus tigrinus ALCF2SS1-6 TaxID=1328759 RepID=A0A5C2SG96_9APHY|nr:hypothetical protein L227DRAFT_609436 [Lentinus tigrinus ALCF2SS1-6]
MLPAKDALLVLPVEYSGPNPARVVLNFWDETLMGSSREEPTKSTFTLEDLGARTRYVFSFAEDIEFARCMELFFITRRLLLDRKGEIQRRDHEIERLQEEVFPHMADIPGDCDTAKDLLKLLQTELGIKAPSTLPLFSAGTPESRDATLNVTVSMNRRGPWHASTRTIRS